MEKLYRVISTVTDLEGYPVDSVPGFSRGTDQLNAVLGYTSSHLETVSRRMHREDLTSKVVVEREATKEEYAQFT